MQDVNYGDRRVTTRILRGMRVNFRNLYLAREIIDVYHFVKRFVFSSVVYYPKFIIQVYYPKKQVDEGSSSHP